MKRIIIRSNSICYKINKINMQNPRYFGIPHHMAFSYPRKYYQNEGFDTNKIITLSLCGALSLYGIFIIIFNIEGILSIFKPSDIHVISFIVYFFFSAALKLAGIVIASLPVFISSAQLNYIGLYIVYPIDIACSTVILIWLWNLFPWGVISSIITGMALYTGIFVSTFLHPKRPQYLIIPNY